jgi:hypothetical protein
MALSSELISQLAKATKPAENKPTEATVFGTTILGENGDPFVQIDGSDAITPVTSTVRVNSGERVVVRIGNHSAVVMGNMTTPSASTDDVEDLADEITEMGIVIADKVSAEELDVVIGHIDTLIANDATITGRLEASEASIAKLEAVDVDITGRLTAAEASIGSLETGKLDATFASIIEANVQDLTAINAVINNLDATYATFDYLKTKYADIDLAFISEAAIKNLSAEFANVDFANIGEAAIEKLFSESGIIKDLVMSDGVVTGELIGVTIKGDLIEASTLKADRLVVKGEDGLYYTLNIEAGAVASAEVSEEDLQNGLHGTAIIAKTVTAEKIFVDDLVSFDATIGGFNITTSSIYSGVKESINNTTRGIYLDKEGQIAAGDSASFIKYYKAEDNSHRLEIAADSLMFSTNGKTVEQFVDEATDFEIGARNLIRNSVSLMHGEYYFESVGPSNPVVVEHDGAGNVFVTSSTLTVDHDGAGNVFLNGGI